MRPDVLADYLRAALESDNWSILVLRNRSEGAQLELDREHVVKLLTHLESEAVRTMPVVAH